MITENYSIPLIKQSNSRDYVFLLEDLELAMHKNQLKRVVKKWNEGMELEEIGREERRDPVEILVALIHEAKRGKKLRTFARRM